MQLRTLLTIKGLLALGFGLGFLLLPAFTLGLYGGATDAIGIILTRFFGAALVEVGVVFLVGRDVAEGIARRALVLGGFVGSAAGLIVALMGQLAGHFNALGWSTVAIYGLLLVGFGSFAFRRS